MREGLDVTLPTGRVWADVEGAWSSSAGALARLEAGWRVSPHLGLFGFGEWRPGGAGAPAETRAGGGVRVTW